MDRDRRMIGDMLKTRELKTVAVAMLIEYSYRKSQARSIKELSEMAGLATSTTGKIRAMCCPDGKYYSMAQLAKIARSLLGLDIFTEEEKDFWEDCTLSCEDLSSRKEEEEVQASINMEEIEKLISMLTAYKKAQEVK